MRGLPSLKNHAESYVCCITRMRCIASTRLELKTWMRLAQIVRIIVTEGIECLFWRHCLVSPQVSLRRAIIAFLPDYPSFATWFLLVWREPNGMMCIPRIALLTWVSKFNAILLRQIRIVYNCGQQPFLSNHFVR